MADMITLNHLFKTYHIKGNDVKAVQDVSLSVKEGEIYGIIGYSGAGKSSLVRCINLLEVPDEGSLCVGGHGTISFRSGEMLDEKGRAVREKQLSSLRRDLGMIFQQFNLMDRSTVFENIAYPLKFRGISKKEINDRVSELLQLVDLTEKRNVYPSQLSGGQKQRVAIARALASNPKVLLSDEATSALDPEATESILKLLKDLNKRLGLTIVLITHEMAVIKQICDRVAVMENGFVVEENEVYNIFSDPKENMTRRFVDSASPLSRVDKIIDGDPSLEKYRSSGALVKLTFGKETVGDALISQVSRQCNVNVNIVLANVEILQGQALGGMIAALDGSQENVNKAKEYLTGHNVRVEVVTDDRAA